MNDLAFISENVKQLKIEYGTRLVIGRKLSGGIDFATGKQSLSSIQVIIERAIQLPNQINAQFLASIGVQTKGLDILTGTIQILLDADDVPDTLDLTANDLFAIRSNRRFTIIKADVYPGAAILWLKDVGAAPPSQSLADRLTFVETLTAE